MEIARYWRTNSQRYNLKGTICAYCGKPSFSPRSTCDACQNESAVSHRKAQLAVAPAGETAHR